MSVRRYFTHIRIHIDFIITVRNWHGRVCCKIDGGYEDLQEACLLPEDGSSIIFETSVEFCRNTRTLGLFVNSEIWSVKREERETCLGLETDGNNRLQARVPIVTRTPAEGSATHGALNTGLTALQYRRRGGLRAGVGPSAKRSVLGNVTVATGPFLWGREINVSAA